MPNKKYDLTMKVKLCPIHKEFFNINTKTEYAKTSLYHKLNLSILVKLSLQCKECEWKISE